jgi:hypothetical protein
MPPVTPAPTLYRSVIPKKDYKRIAQRLNEIEGDTREVLARRDAMVGTPTDIANLMAQRNELAAAAYLSSLPTGEGTGEYDPVKVAANQALELAKARKEEIEEQAQMKST